MSELKFAKSRVGFFLGAAVMLPLSVLNVLSLAKSLPLLGGMTPEVDLAIWLAVLALWSMLLWKLALAAKFWGQERRSVVTVALGYALFAAGLWAVGRYAPLFMATFAVGTQLFTWGLLVTFQLPILYLSFA